MPKEESLCVIIPVHKPDLTADEILSLKACKKQLENYDCYLVFPESMDISAYLAVFDKLIAKPVDKKWLSSVEYYNQMKLGIWFYRMFEKYKFMLTYELDAYIFHADFNKVNVFSFDFIGAPFFQGYLQATSNSPFIKGCNSGFSVRNIEKCIHILDSLEKYRGHWNFYKKFFYKIPKITFHLNRLTKGRFDIFINGMLGFYFEGSHMNEDQVWSQIVPRLYKTFKVADPKSASRFSFEHNPEVLFETNQNELPLGCHAWSKYSNFWKKYIIDYE